MKRYDWTPKFMGILSTGSYVPYYEAQEEIENRDRKIDLLKGELELSKQEVYFKDQIIAQTNPCGHTGFESVSCDVCGYPDSRKLIAKLRAKNTQIDRVGAYYRVDYVESLAAEVTELKDKFTRLTALIESKEMAEKVVRKYGNHTVSAHYKLGRERGVNDYRALLMEEVRLISAVITKEDMEHYTEDIGI
jgi:hypothetical protein